MASITVNPSQSFPEGTVVGVYARAAKNPGGAPVGAQVTSATVTAGALAFTGLVLNTLYTAYALVSSQHRYVDFAVREADVATRRQVQAGITLVEVSVDLPSVNANATADVNVAVPAGTCTAGISSSARSCRRSTTGCSCRARGAWRPTRSGCGCLT